MNKLRVKFFVVILAVNMLLAGGLYLFLKVSFDDAFSQYVNQRDRELAERIVGNLESYYEVNQSWTRFEAEPDSWLVFLRRHMRRRELVRGIQSRHELLREGRDDDRRRSRSMHSSPPEPRPALPLYLLDGQRNFIAGLHPENTNGSLRPIVVGQDTVGYLGVPEKPGVRDYLDHQFAAVHGRNLMVMVLGALAVAFLSAIPLSRFLVQRIDTLVEHVKSLSRGRYNEKLSIKGRDELNELARHLNALGQTLDSIQRERQQWVADISHELRTPVSILQADLESMEDGVRPLDETAVPRLQKQVARLTNLISDLYQLSLSDLGSMTYSKQEENFAHIVGDALEQFRAQFQAADLDLRFQTSIQGSARVLGDRQRLQQLVLNLLQNALNYTDAPGRVELELTGDKHQIILTVSDSAPGVDEALIPRLTERLFRVDESRNRQTGGAGLGLSLSANIVKAHDGELSFSQSALGGLQVTVRLPTMTSD